MELFSLENSSPLDVDPTSHLTVSGSGKQRKPKVVASKNLVNAVGSSSVSRYSVWKPPQLSLQQQQTQPSWNAHHPNSIARKPFSSSHRSATAIKRIPDEFSEANSKQIAKFATTTNFNSMKQRKPLSIHGGNRGAPSREDSDGERNNVESDDDSNDDSEFEQTNTQLNSDVDMGSNRKPFQSDVEENSEDDESVGEQEKVLESYGGSDSGDSENLSDSVESENEPEIIQGAGVSSSKPSKRAMEVIYFRTTSSLTAEKGDRVMDLLRVDHPNSKVILEIQSSRAPIVERKGFERLLGLLLDRRVKKLLIANTTQICNTKDAFQLFEWLCNKHGTEIDIQSSLGLP